MFFDSVQKMAAFFAANNWIILNQNLLMNNKGVTNVFSPVGGAMA